MPARSALRSGFSRRAAPLAGAAVVLLAWLSHASGQLLNFDTASPPAPGQGKTVLGVIEALDERIAVENRAARDEGGVGGAALRLAARRLARALLDAGERAGEPGSERVVAGYTLMRALPEVDRIAALIPGGDRPDLERAAALVAAGAMNAGASWGRTTADALALLDRLADAGPGADGPADGAAQTSGWITHPGGAGKHEDAPGAGLSGAISAWEAQGLDAATVLALRDISAALAAADAWPAYRRGAAHIRAVLIRAGAVLGSADPALVHWLPPEIRTELAARFARAVADIGGEAGPKARGSDEFHRLAVTPELARRLGALNVSALVERPLRESFARVVAAHGPGADEALLAFASAVDLADRRVDVDEAALAREARPAWRTLVARAKRSQSDLVEAVSRIGASKGAGAPADPMAEPALVGAIAAHKRALDDLRAVAQISGFIGPEKPGEIATKENSKIHARVLRLGRELAGPDHAESALAALRQFASALEDHDSLERSLGAGLKPDEGKQARLADAWRKCWSDFQALWAPGPGSGATVPQRASPAHAPTQREVDIAAERLRLLRRLGERYRQSGILGEMTAPGGGAGGGYLLQSWPGWEMERPVLAALCSGLHESLDSCADLALAGKNEDLRRALDAIDKSYCAALLAAVLESGVRGLGMAEGPALSEVAEAPIPVTPAVQAGAVLGIAPATWLSAARPAIADVCRYAPEFAGAVKPDPKRARRIRDYVELRAGDALR